MCYQISPDWMACGLLLPDSQTVECSHKLFKHFMCLSWTPFFLALSMSFFLPFWFLLCCNDYFHRYILFYLFIYLFILPLFYFLPSCFFFFFFTFASSGSEVIYTYTLIAAAKLPFFQKFVLFLSPTNRVTKSHVSKFCIVLPRLMAIILPDWKTPWGKESAYLAHLGTQPSAPCLARCR